MLICLNLISDFIHQLTTFYISTFHFYIDEAGTKQYCTKTYFSECIPCPKLWE